MYTGMTVANAIIEHFEKENKHIPNLLLQKILYYVNIDYLVHNKGAKPLINDSFEKWNYGPVLPVVYRNYRDYGRSDIPSPIPETVEEIFGDEEDINNGEYFQEKIDSEVLKRILKLSDSIYDRYHTDPFSLVEITHEETPWEKDADKIHAGVLHIPYTNDELYDFFKRKNDGDVAKWLRIK